MRLSAVLVVMGLSAIACIGPRNDDIRVIRDTWWDDDEDCWFELSVEPSTLDFGVVDGETIASIALTSVGADCNGYVEASLSGDAAFSLPDDAFDIVPGETVDFLVSYTPYVEPSTGTLYLLSYSDWGDAAEYAIALSGDGLPASLDVSPTAIDLGEVLVGESAQATLIASNTGGGSVVLRDVVVAGSDALTVAFEAVELAAGESAEIELGYAPSTAGTLDARVLIDAGDALVTVPVTGSAS